MFFEENWISFTSSEIARRIQGRVVGLEQVISAGLSVRPALSTSARRSHQFFKPVQDCARTAFGSGIHATEISTVACLRG